MFVSPGNSLPFGVIYSTVTDLDHEFQKKDHSQTFFCVINGSSVQRENLWQQSYTRVVNYDAVIDLTLFNLRQIYNVQKSH